MHQVQEVAWERAAQQVIREMLGQPDQYKKSIVCKRCQKVRVVINTRNYDEECKDIGRSCPEQTDEGDRELYTYEADKSIKYKIEKGCANTQRSGKES